MITFFISDDLNLPNQAEGQRHSAMELDPTTGETSNEFKLEVYPSKNEPPIEGYKTFNAFIFRNGQECVRVKMLFSIHEHTGCYHQRMLFSSLGEALDPILKKRHAFAPI